MATRKFYLYLFSFVFLSLPCFADSPFPLWEDKPFQIFKTVDKKDLRIYDIKPASNNKFSEYTVLCFFGGGWSAGNPKGSYANIFSNMGFRVIAPEYRTTEFFKGNTPADCVEDGTAAYEWLVENASKLKINKDKIIITGFSAGGHLAAMIPIKSKSKTKPHLVILYSAVLDVSKEGYQGSFPGPLEKTWQDISPLHLLAKGYPQTILFAGEKDTIVKSRQSSDFYKKLLSLKIKSTLNLYPEYDHGLGKESFDKTKTILEEILK